MNAPRQLIATLFMFGLSLGSLAACGPRSSSGIKSAKPLNETAAYTLVKNPMRTVSMIKEGTAAMRIAEFNPSPAGDYYRVQLNYKGKAQILFKTQNLDDSQTVNVPSIYFTAGFWEDLEKNGSYKATGFNVALKERGTASLDDGRTFPDAFHIQITDFADDTNATIKNLAIDSWVVPNLAAIGAVQIDLHGQAPGIAVKAGFDLAQ
jgi:hypothetical protein